MIGIPKKGAVTKDVSGDGAPTIISFNRRFKGKVGNCRDAFWQRLQKEKGTKCLSDHLGRFNSMAHIATWNVVRQRAFELFKVPTMSLDDLENCLLCQAGHR